MADGTKCETDTDKCTVQECKAGECKVATVITSCAPDGNPCTDDACHADTGCYAPMADGTKCETDTDKCTEQECKAGECKVATVITSCVPDGNPCTDDACHADTGCYAPMADGTKCDDGDYCTSLDQCVSGKCAGTFDLELCPPPGACPPKYSFEAPAKDRVTLPVGPLGTKTTATHLGVSTAELIPTEMVTMNLVGVSAVVQYPITGAKVYHSYMGACFGTVPSTFLPNAYGGILVFSVAPASTYVVQMAHEAAYYPVDSFFDVFFDITYSSP
jgi:hypothetical protein